MRVDTVEQGVFGEGCRMTQAKRFVISNFDFGASVTFGNFTLMRLQSKRKFE